MKNFLYIAFIVTFSIFGQSISMTGQNYAKVDSLRDLLKIEKNDSLYFNHLQDIIWEFYSTQLDSSIKYSNIKLEYAKLKNNIFQEAYAQNDLGRAYSVSGKLSKALYHSVLARELFDSIDYKVGFFGLTQNIGILYYDLKDYKHALLNFHEAIDYFEEINISYYLNLIYYDVINCYNEAGYLDSSAIYIEKLAQLEDENLSDKDLRKSNLIYLKACYFSKTGDIDSSIVYFTKSLDESLAEENLYNICTGSIGLAKLYARVKDYDNAIELYNKAAVISLNNSYDKELLEVYENTTAIYDSLGDYELAYSKNILYHKFKDKKNSENIQGDLSELQVKYETEKKEHEIAKQREIIYQSSVEEESKNSRNTFIFILFGIVLFSFILYSYSRKLSHNKLQKQKGFIELQKEQIVTSINYAKKIQNSILLDEESMTEIIPNSFVFFKSKDIVSGDFYWFKNIAGKKVIAIVDCTGHGVPGAFMSLIANNLLEKHVTEANITDTGMILENIHYGLLDSLNEKYTQDGMDMSICVIDKDASEICFSGARNSGLLIRGNDFHKLEATPLSIGNLERKNVRFETNRYKIERGDRLFLYTDGIIDQFGGEFSKKLNTKRFKELLVQLTDHNIDVQSFIEQYLSDWQGSNKQTDDILLFGAQF